jgi:acyl-CoA synthetase (AMP-forming)/AMP-acid ligase II
MTTRTIPHNSTNISWDTPCATMMPTQLTMPVLMDRGPALAAEVEIVSKIGSHVHRYTYAELGRRARQLANALKRLGVQPRDRIATLAWNSYRHLEHYYAVPCMGGVLHTLNLRLSTEQLAYIANHAEDSIMLIDDDLLPVVEKLAPHLRNIRHYIVMSDSGDWKATFGPAHDYEQLLAQESSDFKWPELDENSPMGICYTSGTTGNPKGVVYTHRSNYLHTVAAALPDTMGLSREDTIMAAVPMFHANAWGLPYVCTMIGAKQVFAGSTMDGASICGLIAREKVTFSAGVPTIWLGVMNELKANPNKYDLSSLKKVLCGGSAAPRAVIDWLETNLDVELVHAWGMTETSPLGCTSHLKPKMYDWSRERQLDIKQRAGIISPGLEIRIIDDDGMEVPRDGVTMGRLLIRGPWVASCYFKDSSPEKFVDGWLDTGDIATIDEDGYLAITDRSKDLVKSGGEWISSVDLENAIMAVPGVAEAAVIAITHPKWQERPLACVVPRGEAIVSKEKIYEHLTQHFPKWWLPDDIVFIDAVPKTSVGKFDKKVLRDRFCDYELP